MKPAVTTQYAEDIARTSVGLYMLSCVLYGKSRRPLGLPFNAVRRIFFAQRTLYCVHNVVIRHGKIYPASPQTIWSAVAHDGASGAMYG